MTRSRSRSAESRSTSDSHSGRSYSVERHTMRRRYYSSSRSRSYSRPPSPPPRKRSSRYSPCSSESRSHSPRGHRYASRSRSPQPKRRYNSREKPNQSRCIGVFGLSVYTTQQKIREIFSKFGPIDRIQVVIDAQTGRSRGFCFIYYDNVSDAKAAKDACCGLEVDNRRIRVDYSITQRPHTPTPGIYMGHPTRHHRERDDSHRKRGSHVSSTARNCRSSRRSLRSRSRSVSPRPPRRCSRY